GSGFNSQQLLGYAQFPEGSTLGGVPSLSFNETASTDGAVINTNAFGSNFDASGEPITSPYTLFSQYNAGRTLTHEIGHFLGLRHIWGDGLRSQCESDFVDDTPSQQTDNDGCPNFPQPSCGNTSDMFMNYMDYTNDVCMNLFTQGQVDRMVTVLDNSPRRTELLSSNVAEDIQPNGIYAAFRADRFTIEIGESINITELSFTGGSTSITSWSWNFDLDGKGGVSPSSFNGQNPPTITYNQVGVYRVRLTVSNGSITDERIAEINVLPQPPLDLAIVNSDLIVVDDVERVAKRVEFSWTDQSDEDAFQVIRQPISFEAPAILVETLPANTTAYTDDNFTEEETSQGTVRFAYVVTSVKEGLQSASEVKIVDVRFDQAVTNIEEELSEEVKVYPNPSDGIFTIDLENIPFRSAEVKVYNSLGQCVSRQILAASTKNYLNLESLEGGIYFLQVITEDRTWKTKIVVQ
ncbi:MAG: M43 family zinc metalloprotease, partial [Bacteroidota bacterium]